LISLHSAIWLFSFYLLIDLHVIFSGFGHLRYQSGHASNRPVQLRASARRRPVVTAVGRLHLAAPVHLTGRGAAAFRHAGAFHAAPHHGKPVSRRHDIPRQPAALLPPRRARQLDARPLLTLD
jgi:hypothetical protein